MKIQIGDAVKSKNKIDRLFGALKVIDIEGDYAICVYYLLDKDLNGDERPTALIPTESSFLLEELTLISINQQNGNDTNG
ncbi:hypothetical protein ACQ33O_05300 [Ferruginibacter sp. SUN002]|uniref:hypothetical protein n=1 Tax=Ferruginibacter sp. SUN002 TaxID=2937789 RepID=UPI003D36241E